MLMVSVVYDGHGGDNSGGVVVGQPMKVAAVEGDGDEGGDDEVKVRWLRRWGGVVRQVAATVVVAEIWPKRWGGAEK
ncbi:hypothetical protein Tco_0520327 [Tanacetum coccineum]